MYLPLHADMERWIDSPFGTRVDDFLNHISGHFLIGNGVDGTAADPDGGNAGLWFGDGGNGYGPTGDGGDAGWIMGNGGDAGSATDGGAAALIRPRWRRWSTAPRRIPCSGRGGGGRASD